ARGQATKNDSGDARPGPRRVDAADQRHAEQDQNPERPDPELERRVHTERVLPGADDARQEQTAQAHAAHEGAEQETKGNGRGSDDQLEELKPDDFVNESGTAAADKEQQQRGQIPARRHSGFPFIEDGSSDAITRGMRAGYHPWQCAYDTFFEPSRLPLPPRRRSPYPPAASGRINPRRGSSRSPTSTAPATRSSAFSRPPASSTRRSTGRA